MSPARALALLDLILPVSCAGCQAAGDVWCPRCRTLFGGPLPVHRAPIAQGPPAYALAEYQGPVREMLLAYKERHRRELGAELGAALAKALPWVPAARPATDGTWWLVPVPSRPAAARRRGGQHMLRVARACASRLARRGSPAAVAPALAMDRGVKDSVGLTAAARAANLAGRVRFQPRGAPPHRTPVVLIDDVLTTGATAAACSSALTAVGIPVSAIVTLASTG